MTELERLSMAAHEHAIRQGALTPAERPEFAHLRMKLIDGVPVLSEWSMLDRPDLIADATAVLERMVGPARVGNHRQLVLEYVRAYGRFGLRRLDIASALLISESTVRRAIAPLVADGRVRVSLERTRGTGSRRHRYFWVGESVEYTEVRDETGNLWARTDGVPNGDTGVRYHGSAVQGVTCPCGACSYAFESAMWGELETLERQAGGTGYFAGAERRVIERSRYERTRDALAS